MPRTAWDNAAHSLLERTLDDSANRRSILPESFLLADELLEVSTHIIKDLNVNEAQMAQNLERYGPFAASERVLMALVKAGADRQVMHERLRRHAMQAWKSVQHEDINPLADILCTDAEFKKYVPEAELQGMMDVDGYVGLAPERARALAAEILRAIG